MNTDHISLSPNPIPDPPMQALRDALAGLDAPRGVEKELMAAFAAQHRKPRWYQRLSAAQWSAGGIGSAALAALAALVLMLPLHAPRPGADDGAPQPLVRLEHGAPFIALESLERIAQEPSPRMVATELPRTELARLGVPVTPENAGDSVRAELLVGSGGEPLALRLVSN